MRVAIVLFQLCVLLSGCAAPRAADPAGERESPVLQGDLHQDVVEGMRAKRGH